MLPQSLSKLEPHCHISSVYLCGSAPKASTNRCNLRGLTHVRRCVVVSDPPQEEAVTRSENSRRKN